MTTARLILGLTGLLVTLAVAAAPAPANFQASQPNTTQGPAQISPGGSYDLSLGAGFQKCTELKNGAWHIQTKFTKVVGNPVEIKQDLTKDGPHLQITGQFTKCTDGAFAMTVNSTCSIQFVQTGPNTARLVVKSECIEKSEAIGCEIIVGAGNPNSELEEAKLANITGGEESIANVKGVTTTVKGAGCAIGGIEANKTTTIKVPVIAHSAKVE